MFANPLYHVEIYENITTGTAILQLSAQDRDDNVNMALRYSIVSGNNLERFFIDVFSGIIYVKSPIDRDPPMNESSFLLTVMVHFLDFELFPLSYRGLNVTKLLRNLFQTNVYFFLFSRSWLKTKEKFH